MEQSTPEQNGETPMHRRRVTLSDNRYLIFYTFGDAEVTDKAGASPGEASTPKPEPAATPEGTEERHV